MRITQKMAVGHNLDEDDLAFANNIGGLVCPSLAIFRTDHNFKNFGNITLLMNKSKVNLRADPTHNSDVYSSRFPSCYYKVQTSVLDEFASKVKSAVPEFEKIHSVVDYHESGKVSKGFDSVAEDYMRDPKILMTYARDNGLNPRIYRDKHTTGIMFIDSMEKSKSFINQLKRNGVTQLKENTPEYSEYSQIMYDAMLDAMRSIAEGKGGTPEEIKEDTDYFVQRVGKTYFKFVDDKPQLFFNPHQKILDHIRHVERDPNPIDPRKTRDRLEKLVSSKKQKSAFKSWLSEHIADAFHSPYMNVVTRSGQSKKLAFTAENALKAMKGKINGEEKTIFMGAGSVRSLISKRFTSFREINDNIESLISEDEMQKVGSEFNSRLAEFPDKLAPFYLYQTDSWHYSDAVYEEIADYARTGQLSALESFEDIDPDVLKDLNTFLDELSNGKTHYFEIKKQSIVSISDFDSAVIPRGTSKETIKILRDANLSVTFYDPDNKLSRIQAVNKQQDLLFGEGSEVTLTEDSGIEYEHS